MAELAEYQQWLRDGIRAGAAGDKRNKYLAHLAQYGDDAPFYGGSAQFGNLQYRANNMSNGRDLGAALTKVSGAELRAYLTDKINNTDYVQLDYDDHNADMKAQRGAVLRNNALQALSDIDDGKMYVYSPPDAQDHAAQVTHDLGRYSEVAADFDPSKFSGHEIIRPGELDNTINGVKEQLGLSDADMDKVDWSKIIKYDPTIGLYTPKGAVKHVDDQGGGWAKYGDAWVKTAFATALAAATGGALAPGVGAAVGSATGSTLASTAASVTTKALLSSAITAGINRRKLNGKNLLLSAAASGVGAGAGDLVASATNTAKNGLPALLASGVTRTALLNKGRIDPRLLAANTAGAYADGLLGAPVYSLGKNAYGAYNTHNRLQSNNGQARRPVRVQGRNGGLLSSGVRP